MKNHFISGRKSECSVSSFLTDGHLYNAIFLRPRPNPMRKAISDYMYEKNIGFIVYAYFYE